MSNRIKNTKRNIIASYLLIGIQMIFTFVSRTVIVNTLGSEYLGISSLFTSILQVMNIAELGFTSSIVYFMYEPLAKNDTETVCNLLSELRRIYKIVGICILVVGLGLIPYIRNIITGDVPEGMNISFLYILYLLNTCISYFLFAHKTALLTALQRLDLTKIANTVVIIIQYSLQLISLLLFKNYYLFVILMVIGTGSVNIFTAYICNKKYPEYLCIGNVDQNIKQKIYKKVRGLMVCNISAVTYTSLDSIIISAYIGLNSVAIYNNYIVIYSSIVSLVTLLRNSMQSSIGNSVASESLEKNMDDLFFLQFLFSVIGMFCTCCMFCMYQPFMEIWMGNGMLLPALDVALICIWFMLSVPQQAFYLYLHAAGMWDKMKTSYIFSTVFNLSMNIILGKCFGITGIILASLLSTFVSGSIWQCSNVLKYYFNIKPFKYYRAQISYFFNTALVTIVVYNIVKLVPLLGILGLIVKGCLCVSVTITGIFLLYKRTIYFTRAKRIYDKQIDPISLSELNENRSE